MKLVKSSGGPRTRCEPAEELAELVGELTLAAVEVRSAGQASLARRLYAMADRVIRVRAVLAAADDPEATAKRAVAARAQTSIHSRTRTKHPTPETRICSRCRVELPVTEFGWNDREAGKLRAECETCFNGTQRSRYVRAGFKVVTVEVVDGDPCVGHACPVCGDLFEVGQTVQGVDVRHEGCGDDDG